MFNVKLSNLFYKHEEWYQSIYLTLVKDVKNIKPSPDWNSRSQINVSKYKCQYCAFILDTYMH